MSIPDDGYFRHVFFILSERDCLGRDRMVIGFTTTYAVDANPSPLKL